MKNLRFGQQFIASLLALSLVGGVAHNSFSLYKKSEINRIKGYLEDFLTEDNYVDLSKISKDYDIKNFDGKYLDDAMKDLGVRYVRLTDTYVYDGSHVTPFQTISAINYDIVIFVDSMGNESYQMYEPIRVPSENGVEYIYPEGFELVEESIITEPFRYSRLEDTEVVVRENNYEESYSLSLEKKR